MPDLLPALVGWKHLRFLENSRSLERPNDKFYSSLDRVDLGIDCEESSRVGTVGPVVAEYQILALRNCILLAFFHHISRLKFSHPSLRQIDFAKLRAVTVNMAVFDFYLVPALADNSFDVVVGLVMLENDDIAVIVAVEPRGELVREYQIRVAEIRLHRNSIDRVGRDDEQVEDDKNRESDNNYLDRIENPRDDPAEHGDKEITPRIRTEIRLLRVVLLREVWNRAWIFVICSIHS